MILAIPALLSGLIDSRTRFLTTSLTVMVLVFAVVPSNGAWIHDYWNFPILLALFPGFAVMSEWLVGFLQEKIASEKTKKSTSIKLGSFTLLAVILILVLQPADNTKRT